MNAQAAEDKSSLGWHEFARYSGNRFDTSLFDTNLSSEIGRNFVHFMYILRLNKKNFSG